jgi:hypothetical protein
VAFAVLLRLGRFGRLGFARRARGTSTGARTATIISSVIIFRRSAATAGRKRHEGGSATLQALEHAHDLEGVGHLFLYWRNTFGIWNTKKTQTKTMFSFISFSKVVESFCEGCVIGLAS